MAHTLSLDQLLAIAVALGARDVRGWTEQEESLVRTLPQPSEQWVNWVHGLVNSGRDPLGDCFCDLFSTAERRPLGAVYTPAAVVAAMSAWANEHAKPVRVVDPGVGSGRFLLAAGRTFEAAQLVGVELDPRAAILARGQLAAAGFAGRSCIIVADYRAIELERVEGQTLFIGNPPYVRHHLIGPEWKAWFQAKAQSRGYKASALAGLHVHFILATLEYAQTGDIGVFVTAAEWLDVNYGRLVRQLLLDGLGGIDLHIIEPTAEPFPGTATTGVIVGFQVGSKSETIRVRRVVDLAQLGALPPERVVTRDSLQTTARWSTLTRPVIERRSDFVELGELFRVHRGQVTGANKVWIADSQAWELPPSVLYPSVTKASDLFKTTGVLDNVDTLRCVIDIPSDLSVLDPLDREGVARYLQYARAMGADRGYIASHRKAWWSVGLRASAPILATYMARRPPIFVLNLANARHINIAHGLYPRQTFDQATLQALARFLSRGVSVNEGRTYSGGLTKFEPREMERLLVPRPEVLADPDAIAELIP